MTMTLLDIYKAFGPALELEIKLFDKRSRDMLDEFQKTTTAEDDLKKLALIETQIGVRAHQVRQLGRSILMNIENASLSLHSSSITEWLSEEVKKKTPGTVSLMTEG